MTYLSWASFYEGDTDRSYFDVLIPRILEAITAEGTRPVTVPTNPAVILGRRGRTVESVGKEICESREAFHIVFIHADTGGRSLSGTIDNRGSAYCEEAARLCEHPSHRCVIICPRHETEAWVLADPRAVTEVLGYRRPSSQLGLPEDAAAAERLVDPKQVLANAVRLVQGRRARRGIEQLFAPVAQIQSLAELRRSVSFRQFEERLRSTLGTLGCFHGR